MQRLELGPWSVRSDPELTSEAYARIDTSGAELCGCEPCLNFALARHLVYPTDAVDLLEWLGIDPLLESDLCYCERLASGLHSYAGVFHFVGAIEEPPRRVAAASTLVCRSFSTQLVRAGEGLSVGFFAANDDHPDVFSDLPLVELAFSAHVPWVSNADEPR